MAPKKKTLRVEVPDALRGVALEQRLSGSELRSEPEGWAVVATIQQWLHDEAIERTTVHFGGRPLTMTRD